MPKPTKNKRAKSAPKYRRKRRVVAIEIGQNLLMTTLGAAAGGFSTALFRENAGVGAIGGGPFARANAGLGAIA